MKLHEKIMGKNRENIPNWAFRLMTFIMKMMDIIANYSNRNFERLGIKKGQTVVDYGCGPARYIENISKAIGRDGMLYAADIHPLAINKVREKIVKFNLCNVDTVFLKGYPCSIPANIANVVLALDMFHMVEDTKSLLKEFNRIVKPDGMVIIEDGHQARDETKKKILDSGYFIIEAENNNHVRCKKQ
ncbi:MAG: class I SAM-dependent methyltransferase [Salinivirgaceae bacterium]|nr:class I SAM-dependent methyltransferase [Salinivirgaceae bacterium]